MGAGFYQQRCSLDILEKMTGNPSSGGLTNAGIGLGIGLSVAGQVGNIFTGVGQNINANQPGQTRTCSKCGAKNI